MEIRIGMAIETPVLPHAGSARATARTVTPSSCGVMLFLVALIALQLVIWFQAVHARGGLDIYARGSDFSPTLAAVEMLRAGNGTHLYGIAAQHDALVLVLTPYRVLPPATLLPFLHPPFEALVLAPLQGLSYGGLYLVWSALSLTAFSSTLVLLARALPLALPTRLLLLLGCCSYNAIHYALWLGQSSPFVTLGLCGTFVALRRGRVGWAGIALALVTLKPQLLLVIGPTLLLLGYWRVVMVATATLATASVAAMPFLGVFWPFSYARFLIAINKWDGYTLIFPEIMPNWRGVVVNLFWGSSGQLVTPIVAGLSYVTIAALIWVGWRACLLLHTPIWNVRTDLFWAFAVLLAILVAPHLYLHDLTALVIPAWIVVATLPTGLWPVALTRLWPVLFWAISAVSLPVHLTGNRWPAGLIVFTALLCLCAAALLGWRCLCFPAYGAASDPGLGTAVLPARYRGHRWRA